MDMYLAHLSSLAFTNTASHSAVSRGLHHAARHFVLTSVLSALSCFVFFWSNLRLGLSRVFFGFFITHLPRPKQNPAISSLLADWCGLVACLVACFRLCCVPTGDFRILTTTSRTMSWTMMMMMNGAGRRRGVQLPRHSWPFPTHFAAF